jgi:hypothetical protein
MPDRRNHPTVAHAGRRVGPGSFGCMSHFAQIGGGSGGEDHSPGSRCVDITTRSSGIAQPAQFTQHNVYQMNDELRSESFISGPKPRDDEEIG